MSSLPTRGSRAAKQHQRKPYERPPPSPAPQLARSKSSFFSTVKALVVAPFSSWISGGDEASTAGSNVTSGEGRHLKRRASKNRVDNGEGTRPKRMRTTSPQRIPLPTSGYLDPPEQMLRHTISAGTFARPAGIKPDFTATHNTSGDFTHQIHPSIRNTPLHYSSLHVPQSPSRRAPSVSSWFPQPSSTRNSLAPRPSQVHFGNLPNLNIDAAIASYDDSRMASRSPSVSAGGLGVGLGRERTPSRALPSREPSMAMNRTSLSRATGHSVRASLSVSNPFASLGKSSSVAPERKRSTLIWDDSRGVTTADNTEAQATPAPSAKNTAERLLNALENMHTHTGDAQRPRRRPASVQVPTPGPSVPDKLKRMIQPYGEVSPGKGKAKGGEGRPKSGLMKILMKNKKESRAEEMDLEETSKPAGSTASASVVPKASTLAPEKPKKKGKEAEKSPDVDMDAQPVPSTTPALKVIDNFRPASQPPSRPGTSSSLRQSKTVTKRAHVPSAGRNRFSANNDDVEEEDEEATERRNAELLAVASSNVFKVPDGFKFGGSPTPAIPSLKPVERTTSDSAMAVVAPQPVAAKPAPPPILSFTPISAPRSNAPSPTPTFFSEKVGGKSELPDIKNPFASLGAGLSKPEVKVPEVPKWGSVPAAAPAPVPAAKEKPAGGVSPFATIGVPAANPFGKPKENGGATPAGGVSFAKAAVVEAGSNPFAGIGATGKKDTPSAPALPFSFGGSKTETKSTPAPAPAPVTTPAFSFGKPPAPAPTSEKPKEAPKAVVEAPKPSVSPFSFGASQPAEKPISTPSPAPFSFGVPPATTSTPAPVASLAPTPTPAAPLAPTFSFGAPAVVAPTPKPAASPFSFGAPTPAPAPTAPEPVKKNPFDFSTPAATPTPAPVPAPAPVSTPAEAPKNPFDFSSGPAASTSKSPFDFSAKPADKPVVGSPFTFGVPAPTPTPTSVPAAAEKKNPFDFAGTSQKPVSAGFVFGAPAPAPVSLTPTPAPAAGGFSFGAPPVRPATPPSAGDAAMEESPAREPAKIVTSGFGNGGGFGAQPPSTGFAFGGNTNGAASTGPFGGLLNGGGAAQSNGFGAVATPSSPAPFSFGANNGAGSGFASNGFNTNGAATPAVPTPAPVFAFGAGAGAGFPQPASANASPSNPFSQPTPSPFGQPNLAPTNAFTTPASPFPAASPALHPVGFNTGNSGASNAFGSAAPAANGFPGSPATQPAFAFGTSASSVGTASPSTFSFGLPAGPSSPATPTATSSPFVFGQGGAGHAGEGSPAPGVQFNLGTADASPGGRKIKPLRRPRRN
ncbi:hypothetical protein BDV93DRAFT_297521 [Ceratobasidium sp. AG-I]|nr:hypothetical protein BDV93DRAFT_297521 [Ceratobasidium sp. AG-I]